MNHEMWTCSQCGEKNILERLNCYSCLAFKPGPRTPPGPRPDSPTDTPPPINNGDSNPKKTTWACKSCNSVNSYKNRDCYLCDTSRTPSSNHSNSPTPSSSEESDWVCSLCRSQNTAKRENCYTCNAFRESGMVATPSAPDVEYWDCPECSYKTSHGPHCFQCGACKTPSTPLCPDRWTCSGCESANFGKRAQCYSCHKKKTKRDTSPQPVTCPTCKFCNEGVAKECLLCGSVLPTSSRQPTPPKDSPLKKRKITKAPKTTSSSSSSKELQPFIKPEIWKCQSCDYKNIPLRNFCKDCDSPRKCIAKLYIKYKKHGISALENISPEQFKCIRNSDGSESSNCSQCNKPFSGTSELCPACTSSVNKIKRQSSESSTPTSKTNDDSSSLMVKKCSKCGEECGGQYCYNCANDMGIRLESDTWECSNCHLVDENTAICTGCGHNKADVKIAAVNFLTCKHCKTKNHAHKTQCVRCLKPLSAENLPVRPVKSDSPDSWTCIFCEISVVAASTHCRGCNRARSSSEKMVKEQGARAPQQEHVPSPDIEEGEYVEDASHGNHDGLEMGEVDESEYHYGEEGEGYYGEESYSEQYYPIQHTPRPRIRPIHRPRMAASVRHYSQGLVPRFPHHMRARPGFRPRLPFPRQQGPRQRYRPPMMMHRPRNPAANKPMMGQRRQPINMMAPGH